MKLKDVKKGMFFTKKDVAFPSDNQVFIRGEYDRSARRYACTRFSDCSDVQYLSGDKVVFCDFTF